MAREGFAPDRIVVVVNPPGGLDDPELERAVRLVRLASNEGPAGGFRRALEEAFADTSTRWAYVCEDDMLLLHLPGPRVGSLLDRVPAAEEAYGPVGAIVAFGRVFVPGSGHTVNHVPRRGLPGELAPVDVSTWGATLVSRRVVESEVLPDPSLFFGFEDFDFFCRVRTAGLAVLVDVPCARQVAHHQTSAARDAALRHHRPIDADEPWRAFYLARNFFALARRHGKRRWLAWHLLYSLRRLQLATSRAERTAIGKGVLDGARGRLGIDERYLRQVGEHESLDGTADPYVDGVTAVVGYGEAGGRPDLSTDTGELERGVVALVLSHNAPHALERCLDAIGAQHVPPAAVMVVDNASTPPVDLGRHPRTSLPVSVIRSECNVGPAGGWALAFEAFAASGFDHAWVMDDDIVADPECLQILLAAARLDPKTAFFFPRSVQPDGTVGEWGSWCGFVVSRHIVEQVGVPRTEMFWWAEDNEYCHWRIPQAGFERRIVDGAVVQHDAVRHAEKLPLWKYYYEARNMLYLHLHVMHRVGWYPRNVSKLIGRALVRERGRRAACLLTIGRGLVDGALGRLGMRFPVEPMHEQPSAGLGG
jgi:GT2 family glycosyltransferase